MRPIEADWIRDQLLLAGDGVSPILNLGSSTEEFRTVRKPHIDARLFAPLRERGIEVIHADMKAAAGVDQVGDLGDPAFMATIREQRFGSVLCNNLLEHVERPQEVASLIEETVHSGGHIIVTVPYSYPYHPDPIDTLFRPGPEELAALFPECTVRSGIVLKDGTLVEEERGKGRRNLATYPLMAASRLLRVWRPRMALAQLHRLTWLGRSFSVSCVHLQKR